MIDRDERRAELRKILEFFSECIAPKTLADIDRPELSRRQMEALRFQYRRLSRETALSLYRAFVLEVVEAPGVTEKRAEKLARAFARMLLSFLITQCELDEFAHLASHLPCYGLPTVAEILHGEK